MMSDWTCGCGFTVHGSRNLSSCPKCRRSKPTATKRSHQESDWLCPKCNFIVFGRNEECRKCKTPRASKKELKSTECPICCVESDDRLVFNCGHITCAKCYERLKVTGKCPFCKQKITTTIKLFM